MSTIGNNSSVILDSLYYYLDASSTKSYTGGTYIQDLSRFQNSGGTLIGGATYSPSNKGSIVFDGIDEYIALTQITANQTYGKYSFGLWFSPTNTISSSNTNNYMLVEAQNTVFGGVDNYIHLLAASSGRLSFQTFNPFSIIYTSTNTWVSGQWYNIMCTYDITTSKQSIYVNGVLENFTTVPNCYFNTNTYFNLGTYTGPPKQWFFNGKIANFIVYKKTLSDNEILQNYNAIKNKINK
jgi:hypothetical protein